MTVIINEEKIFKISLYQVAVTARTKQWTSKTNFKKSAILTTRLLPIL